MSDMPDFDSMSQEEMMKWMESLAKRQGAAEGFTTEADLEIEEVDENDERLEGMGDYKPYGMSDEDWAKMQAREAVEKAERLAAMQQQEAAAPPPTPDPEPVAEPQPEPAQPAAATGGEMDVDNMSPEEMMEWMESLAKRQGAAEGFTTSASMQVDEVDENDERLAGMGEYKPYGMSDEDWAKMQEREAAEKAERLAAMQQQEAAAPPPTPDPEPVAEPEPEPAQPAAATGGELDVDNMSPEEMMEWMESLAKRQGAAEGFTTSASMQVDEVDENDERLAGMGEYKPYGMSDEDWAKMQAREATEKAARLAAMQDSSDAEEYTYEDDEDYIDYDDDDEFFEAPADSEDFITAMLEPDTGEADNVLPSFEDILPAESATAMESPMDWLAGLSADDDAPSLDLDLGGLGDLANLGEAESDAGDDPMSWLAGLSADEDSGAMPDLSALMGGDNVIEDDADETEGSLEWMESLAAEEGAESEELVTDASLNIPMPDNIIEDGPGYEDFSFEEATGIVNDTGNMPAITDEDDFVLEDPEGWLDNLASGVGSDEIPEDIFSGEVDNEIPDDIFAGEAFAQADTDEEDSDEFNNLAGNVKEQMDSGRLGDDPASLDAFFQSAFAKADTRTDVPDYIDDIEDDVADDEDIDLPVAAEIPDWLQESMSSAPQEADDTSDDTPAKRATAEMMIADLGLDEDEDLAVAEIPDWLSGTMEDNNVIEEAELPDWIDDASDDEPVENIFAEDVVEEAELNLDEFTDTQDTWVAAFSEDDGDLEDWYNSAVAELDGDNAFPTASAEAVAPVGDVTLEHAELPIESNLPEGSPQNVPDWLGTPHDQSVEVEAVQNDMSWLGEDFADDDADDDVPVPAFILDDDTDDADIPDWLMETVDDSITANEDLPDWLAGETDIAADDVPDWLRETMDEEESVEDAIPVEFLTDPDPEPVAPVASTPLPVPVQQSPAPVPVAASNVDAVAYLRSAKGKIEEGDVDGAMLDYEQIIRANKALSQVEKELVRLSDDKQYSKNPAVNRVLGDVLMRQGKLQEALDTYRKALNML